MPDHPSHGRFGLRLVPHLPAMVKDFWSSEVNRQVVCLVAPSPGEVVLDVGAGMGAGAFVAESRVAPGGTVIAVDPSRAMRAFMRMRRLYPAHHSIEVRAGSAETLPVAAATVDATYAVNAAHHFADLERFVAEVARVLRPGGRLLLVEEDMTHPSHRCHILAEGGGHGPRAIHGPVNGDAVADLCVQNGLVSVNSTYRTVGGVLATVISANRPS